MSGYTDAIWDYETSLLRQIVFPSGRLHLAKSAPAAGRLGFTVCGPRIPRAALVDDEIPERLQPIPCKRCATWLEKAGELEIRAEHAERVG